jgi:hypothetical protein
MFVPVFYFHVFHSVRTSAATCTVLERSVTDGQVTALLSFFLSSSSSIFFFHWHYSPLWALACRTMSFHFSLSATNSLHLLTPST